MSNDIEERIRDLERRVGVLEGKPEASRSTSAIKKLSPKEFVLDRRPASGVDQVLVLAFYLEQHEAHSSVNIGNLERVFHLAKVPVPNNLNLAVLQNVKKGRMMEAGEKKDNLKAWTVTATGEGIVKRGFEGKGQE